MAIVLAPETEKLVEEHLRKGGFSSSDALLRAALALLDQQTALPRLSDSDLESLYPGFRQKIAEGLSDANADRLSDGEAFFDDLAREA